MSSDLVTPDVRAVAAGMTFACATDGNHGRSVAQGAELVGARAVIFVHGGVSDERIAAIARFGAEMIRVDGNYDDRSGEAARVAAREGLDRRLRYVVAGLRAHSRPGHAGLHGDACARRCASCREPPTHVFVQAGVGGMAAAVAGHSPSCSASRPTFIVVEPARAACICRSRPGRAPGQGRARPADRHGHARMLRSLAGGMARAVARRRRLHDGGRGGRRRR